MQTATAAVETTNVGTFIGKILPKAIREKKSLRALFTSYNEIGSFKDGPVETKKKGLEIIVSSGSKGDESWKNLGFGIASLTLPNTEMMGRYLDMEEGHGSATQAEVSEKILGIASDTENVMLMAYMGLNGNKACMDMVEKFRANNPGAFIAVLTCDCNLTEKKKLLLPAAERGVIDSVVVTNHCGGYGDMAFILESLIEQWPIEV